MARIFDLAIPASEYDSIRKLYFDTFVVPALNKAKVYSISETWEEFKRETERPSAARATKRTGLTSNGARRLVIWFAGRDHFTVGSSKDDVIRIQGTPDEITDSMWRYGSSRVFFTKDRVVRWDVFPLSPLKVNIRPSSRSDSNRRIFIGASKDEVFYAQGPPNEFDEWRWKYGGCSEISHLQTETLTGPQSVWSHRAPSSAAPTAFDPDVF